MTRLLLGVRYAAGLLLSAPGIGRELSGDKPEAGYLAAITCAAVGITCRQLDRGDRIGLVSPSLKSGEERLYSFRDILLLKVVKRLLDTGISLQQIRAGVHHLSDRSTADLPDVTR